MVNITTVQEFDANVIASTKVVIVDFYADWCGPCRMLSPILQKAIDQFGSENVTLVKVNIDDAESLAVAHNIEGIPDIRIYKGGKVVEKIVGFRPEPEFLAIVQRHL
eukprot:TRINITY_DN227_c0_g2_i1.p1 TRINITY_DN227_c0_g2~~TRINITY_DN227_c0_g2_i1.p1  ORF type:complete len:107 (+),score=45.82 TRINITY_DN227_c0_g2_i1:80-400(+)